MKFPRKRIGLVAGLAVLSLGIVGVAVAASTPSTPTNQTRVGRGINEYGMTQGFHAGKTYSFTYTKGFFCDRSVRASSSTGCEGGKDYRNFPPNTTAKQIDPLFITVPLGFNQPMNMIECPTGLICVDHPGTIDLSRLEKTLKPLYPQYTDAQLTAALKNFAVPEHDHFFTTTNGGAREWWDVKIVGVTSQKTFNAIRAHGSVQYIRKLIAAKDKTVVGPIGTNLFLYFGVH